MVGREVQPNTRLSLVLARNALEWTESASIADSMIAFFVAILRAYGRALRSMLVPGMLRHFLWPVLASAVLWIGAGLALWGHLTRLLVGLLQHWPAAAARLSSGSGAELALSTSIHFALYLLSIHVQQSRCLRCLRCCCEHTRSKPTKSPAIPCYLRLRRVTE